MARAAGRRGISEFSVSFLDVICCGFGAIILLLMITKTLEPLLLEKSNVNLQGQIAAREQALFEIRGEIDELRRQVNNTEGDLELKLEQLAELQRKLREILGEVDSLTEQKEEVSTPSSRSPMRCNACWG